MIKRYYLYVKKKKKIKIIARTPLTFGFLSNKINIKKLKNDKNDHRSLWDVKQLKNGKHQIIFLQTKKKIELMHNLR